jgi:flavin-dependent dehydrogenase
MRKAACFVACCLPLLAFAETIETDLLIVGGDESGCAAAVQAARLGVKRIVLVNDIDWLGGQFCTQGIGPIDEWTIVNGKRAEYPASGAFRGDPGAHSPAQSQNLWHGEARQRLVRQQHDRAEGGGARFLKNGWLLMQARSPS